MQTASAEDAVQALLDSIVEFRPVVNTSKHLAEDVFQFLDKLSASIDQIDSLSEELVSEKLCELGNALGIPLYTDTTTVEKFDEIAAKINERIEEIETLREKNAKHEKEKEALEESLLDVKVELAEIIELRILERPDAELRQKLQALVDTIKESKGNVRGLDLKIRI